MFKRHRRLLLLTAALILAAGSIVYLRRPDPIAIDVVSVERGPVEATVANTRAGTVKACRRARLAPALGGQVERLLVKKGDRVQAGQPLLALWNEDLTAQLALARSEAKAAQARREESCLQAEIAEREFQRTERLYRQGLTSEEQLDRARTAAKAGAAACRAATAGNAVSADRVRLAQANLDKTILRAPFDGVVAEITGEPGEFVTPSPPGIPTPPAIDLLDLSCLYVAAPIDEIDAPRIQPGMNARISLDAFGDRRFPGTVRRIAPYVLDIEKQARTVEVEAVFSDPADADALLPGYSADVEVVLDTRPAAIRIPTEAIIEGSRVFIYSPETHRIGARSFEPGIGNWRYTEVRSGLRPGEWVVTSVAREGVEDGALARAQHLATSP